MTGLIPMARIYAYQCDVCGELEAPIIGTEDNEWCPFGWFVEFVFFGENKADFCSQCVKNFELEKVAKCRRGEI